MSAEGATSALALGQHSSARARRGLRTARSRKRDCSGSREDAQIYGCLVMVHVIAYVVLASFPCICPDLLGFTAPIGTGPVVLLPRLWRSMAPGRLLRVYVPSTLHSSVSVAIALIGCTNESGTD